MALSRSTAKHPFATRQVAKRCPPRRAHALRLALAPATLLAGLAGCGEDAPDGAAVPFQQPSAAGAPSAERSTGRTSPDRSPGSGVPNGAPAGPPAAGMPEPTQMAADDPPTNPPGGEPDPADDVEPDPANGVDNAEGHTDHDAGPTTTDSDGPDTQEPEPAPGPGDCQRLQAPAPLQQTIDLTLDEMTGGFEGRTGARPRHASILLFQNTILDQLAETGGTLNYCVRWDSGATVSAGMRDAIEAALQRGVNEWFAKLDGHECWPYDEVPVKVVGWATRDRGLLQWDDVEMPVRVNDIREDAPQCAEACGRFFHQQPGYTYPQCEGGTANHYDMSLWLTTGFQGGAGGDWGQRVGSEYFTGAVGNEHIHIWLHEFGHGLGFPDYYNWGVWAPGVEAPNSVMVAGRAAQVTDWDTWMIRRLYSELKPRL